jgi:RHS repeat-associated protein
LRLIPIPRRFGGLRQIYDASATVVGSTRYDPYGNVMSQGGVTSVFAFAGEQYDTGTGLVYLRARYYSAAQGRFTTRDVWEGDANSPMSYNAWLYAYADSVNLTDASGRGAMCTDPDPTHCGITGPVDDPKILKNVDWINQRGTGGGANACGPASLLIVLRHYGISASLKDISDMASKIPVGQGGYDPTCNKTKGNPVCLSAGAMVKLAQSYGLTVQAHDHWTWEQVRRELAQEHPIIADININKSDNLPVTSIPSDSTAYTGHFVVIYGIDYKNKQVYYRNPLVEKVNQTDFALFDVAWTNVVDEGDPLQKTGHRAWAMAAYR